MPVIDTAARAVAAAGHSTAAYCHLVCSVAVAADQAVVVVVVVGLAEAAGLGSLVAALGSPGSLYRGLGYRGWRSDSRGSGCHAAAVEPAGVVVRPAVTEPVARQVIPYCRWKSPNSDLGVVG